MSGGKRTGAYLLRAAEAGKALRTAVRLPADMQHALIDEVSQVRNCLPTGLVGADIVVVFGPVLSHADDPRVLQNLQVVRGRGPGEVRPFRNLADPDA